MYIERCRAGFRIVNGPQIMILKPAQGERLVSMLLSEMPNVPDRIHLAWELRTRPRAKIVRTFKFENGKTKENYHLEIFIPNQRKHSIFRGPTESNALNAIVKGYEEYGRDVEITEATQDEVSRKLAAEDERKYKTTMIALKKYGMTLDQLMRYVAKHKDLPKEVTK